MKAEEEEESWKSGRKRREKVRGGGGSMGGIGNIDYGNGLFCKMQKLWR